MKTPRFFSALAGFVLCTGMHAQIQQANSGGSGTNTGRAVQEKPSKSNAEVNARRQPQAMAVSQQSAVNEMDPYQGRMAEFLGMLTVTTLPADFPGYTTGEGTKAYNEKVMAYLRQHPDIVKEQVKAKLQH